MEVVRYTLPSPHDGRGKAWGYTLPPPGSTKGRRWTQERVAPEADLHFPHPRTGRPVSIRSLFDALRDEGVEPHPLGEGRDGEVVLAFQRFAQHLGPAELGGGAIELPDLHRLGERVAAVRSRWFGVDRARVPWPYADRSGAETADGLAYGTMPDVFADIAELHGRFFREGLHNDLTWHHVFTDTPIPKPGEILELLRENRYAALSHFLFATVLARLNDIQLFPTVFVRGGGEGLNPDTHTPNATVSDPVTGRGVTDAPSYDRVRAGRTRHHASAILPSPMGWVPWYYDPATLGLDPPLSTFTTSARVRDDGTVIPGTPDDGTYVETNQRFALNVYNSIDVSLTLTPTNQENFGIVAWMTDTANITVT